ncbi:MAG TPA: hypothetical protein VFS40_06710 [Gemmatimonadales bacterium]|nr:hypothetical protein [Gemmatimonadales bacterium]
MTRFRSFWQAGFEAACHVNRAGTRLDLIAATQHDREADADYARLAQLGLRTVRDAFRWPLVDRGGALDFASARPALDAARRHGVQVVWTLCHYGWPDDLNVHHARFVERFARYAAAAARLVRAHTDEAPWYVPVNEISFLAWAAGEVGYMHPFGHERGAEVKRQLVRAAIAAMEEIRSVDPTARFLHVDPLMWCVPPRGRPDLAGAARARCEAQFEAWDLLLGRREPELGGRAELVDAIGVNYYHSNQREYPDERIPWEQQPRDERWRPLADLLETVHRRYDRPLVLAETSHFGEGRAAWLDEIAHEVRTALARGLPLEGVCLFPVLDRPDWDDPHHWHHSGLWDLLPDETGHLRRVLCREYADALERARRQVPGALEGAEMLAG